GCADIAVRNAINSGLIPGPRMRMSCNAIDINGGHEDNSGLNPAEHLLSNADRADDATEIIKVMRAQRKQGADFTKIYETGRDRLTGFPGPYPVFSTPYQYNEAHLYAAQAGVASIDHAWSLSPETMKLMREKQIYAVPTFAISEYFGQHAETADRSQTMDNELDYHAAEFKKQMAAGVPFAVGSDVGPFPHGTQAREYELMVKFGMSPADTLRAGLINGARLLDWADQIGQLKPGFFADII